MKLPSFDFPVTSAWLELNGRRLDGRPYVSGAMEARVLLEKLSAEKVPLKMLAAGHAGGIYNGPQFVRRYVDDEAHGVPFLTSSTILRADFSRIGLLSKKDAFSSQLGYLRVEEGMTLISCSGTIGRTVYAGPYMHGMWSSQDVLKVVPNPNKILPGYLYAYLSSRFGVPLVSEGTYGAVIQHIEPYHIMDLPVPRLRKDIEEAVHGRIDQAAKLRSTYQQQIKEATDLLFRSVGLRDITAAEWHAMGPDLGFPHTLTSSMSLRALNFNPRLERLLESLRGVPHMTLGEICRGGNLQRSTRFKRIECDAEYGVKLVGQRELFWLEPEGRWISTRYAPSDIFVQDETILVASQGTLGENEVFCRGEFITGPWLNYAYAEHLLRIQPGNTSYSGAFLFAFVRSEMAFRCFRSMSIGSKQQDLHHRLLADFPVPVPPEDVRSRIERLVRDAYAKRHEASRLEKEVIAVVEEVIQEGARDGQHHRSGAAAQ